MANLERDYIDDAPALREFYARPPRELLTAKPRPARWDPSLVAELKERNARLGVAAEVPEEAVPIVTGQQPGLFTGPLYTIYKAVTAVSLARRLEARTGVRHVPVFWVGSDDHDFEETRSAHFLGKGDEPFTLTYAPAAGVDGRPMFRVPLEASLGEFIDRAAAETRGSEQRDGVVRFLRESLAQSDSFADWTARQLAWLFRGTPLLIVAPHWPAVRRLATPVLLREIEEPLRSTALLNGAGARLQELGYPPQVTKGDRECNFFLLVGDRRCKVVYDGGAFVLPETGQRFTVESLRDLAASEPERFSPNVALRCLVQQRVLSPAAYVAGPGEIAYWGQLKELFAHLGLPMPSVYPRAHGLLTTVKLNKLRDKLGLSVEDLYGPFEPLAEKALAQTANSPAVEAVRARRGAVEAAARELAAALNGKDANAHGMAAAFAERVRDELDRLERAAVLGQEAQREAVERQTRRLCNALAPWRKPQERVYTVFSFLFEQGPGLISRLLDELDPESFRMQEVELL